MRVLFAIPLLFFSFQILGQDICTFGQPTDEPLGCIPCSIKATYPNIGVTYINAVVYDSDSLTADTTQYDFPCGTIEKGAWFTYFANDTGAIAFTFFHNICFDSNTVDFKSDVEIGLYNEDLNLITCTVTDSSFEHNGLTPYQKIHFLIDGTNQRRCNIQLAMQYPRIAKNIEPIAKIKSTVETDAFCLSEEVCFSVAPDDAVVNYNWVHPKNGTVISGGRTIDNEMCVRFNAIGLDTIAVTASNPCHQGQTAYRAYGVYEINDQFGTLSYEGDSVACIGEEICINYKPSNPDEDFVWYTSSNIKINSGGDTSDIKICISLNDYDLGEISIRPLNGCNQSPIIVSSHQYIPATNLPPIRVCKENFPVEVEGIIYEEAGFYSKIKTSKNGCDSIINFSIKEKFAPTGIFNDVICPEDLCVQIGDSCYAFSSGTVFVDRPEPLCDSMVILVPKKEDIDEIFCTQAGNSIFFNWKQLQLADRYAININGFLDTISTNQIIIDQLSSDSIIQFSVQPIGSCAFPDVISVTCNFDYVGNQEQFISSKIKIHPNPSDNITRIKTDLKIEMVEIFDLAGRLLERKNDTSFSLKKYGSGIYFFKIKTEEGVGVKRVIVQ